MSTAKKEKLIPPDLIQCQAEMTPGTNPFTMGGPNCFRLVRCTNKPTVVATETRPPGRGRKKGAMALCDRCLVELIKKHGSTFFTSKLITSRRRR